MNRFARLTCAALCAACLPLSHAAQVAMPAPLEYVQQTEPMEGKTLILRQASCEAPGKPLTQGRAYFRQEGSHLLVVRVEYNEQGKYVLEHGNGGKSYQYFQEYVQQQKPLSIYTLNTLLGLWRLFGYRFSLDNVTYHCQLS